MAGEGCVVVVHCKLSLFCIAGTNQHVTCDPLKFQFSGFSDFFTVFDEAVRAKTGTPWNWLQMMINDDESS